MLTDRSYTLAKYTAQIVLPGLATLYFALAQIWGLPKGEEVVGTIAAVNVFLGALLGLSTHQYNKSGAGLDGSINILENPDATKVFSLELDSDPEQLDQKKQVTFKVNKDH